ncbi:MAG: Gfo/Idh/MocA family oxidoreductase [Candidatus Nanohaloarchaea archaeon]
MADEKLKVYQIGLQNWGRYGFEKLIDLHRHLEEVDVELVGVCDKDMERLEKAEEFARHSHVDLETFLRTSEMYDHAAEQEGPVMVYDAGPPRDHANHVYESLRRNFFHVAERPPSLDREQHVREKQLAEDSDVMWTVDFIERENPVVLKALELVEDREIDSLKVFRESSVGIQKLLEPVRFFDVRGGDLLHKMSHDIYALDILENSAAESNPEFVDGEMKYVMPKDTGSDKVMTVTGNQSTEIGPDTATGMSYCVMNAGGTRVELHSSWLGLSGEAENFIERFSGELDHELADRKFREAGEKAFLDEEAAFFVIEGEKDLLGDMLHGRLYDLETGDELGVPDLMHDQLHRVLKNAVLRAAGKDSDVPGSGEVDRLMEILFDTREAALDHDFDFYSELDRSLDRIDDRVIEDGKILEHRGPDGQVENPDESRDTVREEEG